MRVPNPRTGNLVAIAFLALLSSLGLTVSPRAGFCSGESVPLTLRDMPQVKKLQRDLNNEGEQRIREARERARERAREAARAKNKKPGLRKRGERVRPVAREGMPLDEAPVRRRVTETSPPLSPLAVPPNVRHNEPAGDSANSAQSEVSLAIVGQYGLSSWNDGQGFITPPNGQGVAYTTDGGATWVDAGLPPLAGTITDWISDPVVAVNEKTGEFYFCALTAHDPNVVDPRSFGIGVVRATFPGGVFTWDTPHVAAGPFSDLTDFLDKEWLVADSTNGNLYLTYTHFVPGGGQIFFQRSTDGGATWGAPIQISSNNGNVQASRPMVSGGGTVYVTWKDLGPSDVDFVKLRRSLDQGVSFQPERIAFSFYDNFGTGAPGFNRARNVVEPCPVVDRSNGPHRGRLYAVIHESLNFWDDPIGPGPPKSSVEIDNFFSRANPFTIGQTLRGRLDSSGPDLDFFSFPATAGTSYIFFCDSIGRPLYTMRVFCGADTATRLALGGVVPPSTATGQALIVWTAPTSGTYYLRMGFQGGSTGNYRVRTAVAAHGTEPGRDQRDIIMHYSDDDGTTWSAARRLNDDAALYDNFLPEIGVTTEGYPYSAWYDWRDAASSCGGQSHVYVSRSLDGDSWAANQRVSSAPTAWTTAATNIAPNQGDYIGLYGGEVLALGWGDARTGEADVNVWGTTISTAYDVACPADAVTAPDTKVSVNVVVTNQNQVFANTYDYSVTIDRSWTVNGPGTVTVAEDGGTNSIPLSITVPDTADGTARVCVTVTLGNARVQTCCFNVTAVQQTAVLDPGRAGFAIHRLSPNPARHALDVTFSLPHAAPARLELVDINGRRIAAREVGSFGAGRHTLRFERELLGLPAGVYGVKLVQGGRALAQKVSIVR